MDILLSAFVLDVDLHTIGFHSDLGICGIYVLSIFKIGWLHSITIKYCDIIDPFLNIYSTEMYLFE